MSVIKRGLIRSITAITLMLGALAIAEVGWAHAGHGQLPMWQACERATVGAECSFENAAHDRFIGSCRQISEDLVCVRNRPIQHASPPPQPPSIEAQKPTSAYLAGFALVLSLFGFFVATRSSDPYTRSMN